jgi:GTP-binding protein LepA
VNSGNGVHHHAGSAGGAAFTAPRRYQVSRKFNPRVFAGLYPSEASEYESLRCAGKLKLNDASLHYEPEVTALGFDSAADFVRCTWRRPGALGARI